MNFASHIFDIGGPISQTLESLLICLLQTLALDSVYLLLIACVSLNAILIDTNHQIRMIKHNIETE